MTSLEQTSSLCIEAQLGKAITIVEFNATASFLADIVAANYKAP